MKKDILFIVLLVLSCVYVLVFICLPENQIFGNAVNGVLDLRNKNLSNKSIKLNGEWLVSIDEGESVSVNFPQSQSVLYGAGNRAVYKLTILTETDDDLDMFIPEITDTCEVIINGKSVFKTEQIRTGFVSFTPSAGISVIEIVSEYRFNVKIGMRNSLPKISLSPYLTDTGVKRRLILGFVLGEFLMIGFYHLLLYIHSPKEKIYLVFFLMCLFEVGQMLFETHSLISWVLPLDIEVYYRIYLTMICLHGIFMCIFTSFAFGLSHSKSEKIVITFMFTAVTVSVLVLPLSFAIASILLGYLPILIFVIKIFAGGKHRNNRPLLLYLVSLLLFMLSGAVKLYIELPYDIYMFPLVCGLFMILSQCYLLSRNYLKALLDVENLNRTLENQVLERTRELITANKELQVSQNAIKEMIGDISHDLKTPLTVLGQYLELLDDENTDLNDDEKSGYIHVAYNKNLSMQRLIQNLFEATRIETGQLQYKLEWLPLVDLLTDIEDKHGKYLRDRGLKFSIKGDSETQIRLDILKFWNVIDNLLYNAARHTPEGGAISITTKSENGKCEIYFSDTGEGMAEEHLPHIFERFYKVSKARSESGGDSGIGLYIAKTTVEGMGGSISVESALNIGTCFTVTLEANTIYNIADI